MVKVKVPLKDIQLSQLNGECLLLASKFVRLLKTKKGIALKMQDSDILVQISDRAYKTKDKELKEVYAALKEGILKSVSQSMKT